MIELLAVITIMAILMAMLAGKMSDIRESSKRRSCTQNIKILTQAIIAESILNGGAFKSDQPVPLNITSAFPARAIFGYCYEPGTWDSLSALICPNNSEGIHPGSNGWNQPVNMLGGAATIDYWVVHAGNTLQGTLNTMESPGQNVLVIERFSGGDGAQGAWALADYHQTGGTVGFNSGGARFETAFPENVTPAGAPVAINSTNVSD